MEGTTEMKLQYKEYYGEGGGGGCRRGGTE